MFDDLNNADEPDEAVRMLDNNPPNANGDPALDGVAPFVDGHGNGSNGLAEQRYEPRAHSSSPRRIPLFERASERWWNPQFASPTLETQYWKVSFPLLRDRFRSGLLYILLTIFCWMTYFWVFDQDSGHHWIAALILSLFFVSIFLFTFSVHYQRFYLPTSFFCTFLICMATLLIFSGNHPYMGPIACLGTSIQVVLLIYTVIPLPLYLCILIGLCYSLLFELLAGGAAARSGRALAVAPADASLVLPGTKFALHICVHLLGVHLFILTQIRQRKTFVTVGQSLLARKDLEVETQFKDHMIQSVMPKKVADELLKETSELRRPSQSLESNCRTSNSTNAGRSSAAESTAGMIGAAALVSGKPPNGNDRVSSSVPNVRKFRPFTMNMMSDVSILFADIAGFTKMSSNKSADELVNLLNDLFGRFDYLCGRCNLEKISTLAGCPEPRADHAKCCVEMGLAMIIAIKQFDMDRGQAVNMRVGIHTGKVMCGMVGTKRFKFDVFSNDVTLANEMESTGVAGRVHISEVTARYLNNQYLLEEAAEYKSMKTYFIAGRSKELESSSGVLNASDSDSAMMRTDMHFNQAVDAPLQQVTGTPSPLASSAPQNLLLSSDSQSNGQKLSFRKKLAGKLKTIQSSSLPISRATTNSIGGGSLRMKLLERNNKAQTCSAQMLNQQNDTNSPLIGEADVTRKSTSMQTLATGGDATPSSNGAAVFSSSVAGLPPLSAAAVLAARAPATAPPAFSSPYSPQLNFSNSTSTPTNPIAPNISNGASTERTSWAIAERIGGKISMDLAHGSSNNSGRGSRSSGLQEKQHQIKDAGSEAHSMGGIDTVISHHQNAASLTRFDTENRDFDVRLAQAIHSQAGTNAKRFWMHQRSLNRWTLHFNQRDVEEEYRIHFAESSDFQYFPTSGLAKHHQLEKHSRLAEEMDRRQGERRFRYSGVFIDLVVSAAFFVVPALVIAFGGFRRFGATGEFIWHMPRTPFIAYCAFGALFLLVVIVLIGIPLLARRRKKNLFPTVNLWGPRHILGCLLIALPLGVALINMPLCLGHEMPGMLCVPTDEIQARLLYSYIFLIAIYGHCNFSQLGAWPKTAQAILTAFIFLFTTWFCQNNIDHILHLDRIAQADEAGLLRDDYADPPFSFPAYSAEVALQPPRQTQSFTRADRLQSSTVAPLDASVVDVLSPLLKCNHTQPRWASGQFGSPLFIWELVLDTVLAAILVAFLNYQFETAFRMSFYGDLQARRDTAKMILVRDQADWLLTNLIPQHAVDSLKTNTKYSENYNLTAVMFASITNWNEMYEENFEGGREFLRVLNEVFGDFDELLDRPDFCHVEKIKTIGSTYMAASGLNPERRRLSLHPYEHLYQLMEFALALQNTLACFNQDLLNFEFVCKIGLNIGPVTAGVIGTTKLYYDIWGDTVNIASRMYSTGVENRIQVSQHTRDLLIDRYDFEYRDHIEVKGIDGGMDTYLYVPPRQNDGIGETNNGF